MVQTPSGLLNVKGAEDLVQVLQENFELLNLSGAFNRTPSRNDGIETTKYGPPFDYGVWPKGTLWTDVGGALWQCLEYPGDAVTKWRQLDFAICTSFPLNVPDGYRVIRLDSDNRAYVWKDGTSTWQELYLSIMGATQDGQGGWNGSMKGPTILWRDPVEDMEAVTKRYVDAVGNPLLITSFTARGNDDGTYKSTLMVGKTITQVQFDWAYNKAVTSQSINNGVGAVTPVSARTYTKSGLSIATDTTWILTAGDGFISATRSASVVFRSPTYVGADASTAPNGTFINTFPFWLQTNPYLTTSVTPGGKYIWVCYPAMWTTAEIWVGGLKVTDWVVTNPFSHTNDEGYTQNYKCFRSANLLYGSDPISVQIK